MIPGDGNFRFLNHTKMVMPMKLRYDPYQVFRSSKTPAGLYARQKWLGEADMQNWQRDFQGTVTALQLGQMPDGSWRHASQPTIERLFGLHLTVRSPDPQIEAALRWLIDKINVSKNDIQIYGGKDFPNSPLTGLPFVTSRPAMFLTGATLFLATIFGQERNPDILSFYRQLIEDGINSEGRWSDNASAHNIFRAMVVHPEFAQHSATALAVDRLATLQTDRGDWGNDATFYQTLNALAHLDSTQAARQLDRAFERVINSQNEDGSWSLTEPEWNTFLVVHALRSKGVIA